MQEPEVYNLRCPDGGVLFPSIYTTQPIHPEASML